VDDSGMSKDNVSVVNVHVRDLNPTQVTQVIACVSTYTSYSCGTIEADDNSGASTTGTGNWMLQLGDALPLSELQDFYSAHPFDFAFIKVNLPPRDGSTSSIMGVYWGG
jgi:hypothetical protein